MPESKVNDSTEFCLASPERRELALFLVVYFMRNIIRAQKMINFLKKPMRKIKIQIPSQVSKSRGYSSTFFQIIREKDQNSDKPTATTTYIAHKKL